ncbi:MAG: hypothetical protein D5S03_09625 [Desulfonatronospira sp. MSAO_Bac3]|nr:MAG: hypothetical protein D5S03_09625 [Desulfonatronospira sp. MSAO_Bac3]
MQILQCLATKSCMRIFSALFVLGTSLHTGVFRIRFITGTCAAAPGLLISGSKSLSPAAGIPGITVLSGTGEAAGNVSSKTQAHISLSSGLLQSL